MRTKRQLLRTAKLLKEAGDDLKNLKLPPKAKFDMGDWGVHPDQEKAPDKNHLCGTAACAAGWLSLMPKWRKRGFRSKWVKEEYWDKTRHSWSMRWQLVPSGVGVPVWEEMAEDVMGVGYDDIHEIFHSYTSNKKQVVKMFYDLSKEYEKEANEQ